MSSAADQDDAPAPPLLPPPLGPLDAYRADLARERPHWGDGRVAFGHPDGTTGRLGDGAWLVVASFLERVGTAPWRVRLELLRNHERALGVVLGGAPTALPRGHPFGWIAALRDALTTAPERADPDAVTAVVQALAAEMEAAGALHLAVSVLWAVTCALPATRPETGRAVLRQRARLAERLGDPVAAHALACRAREAVENRVDDTALDPARADRARRGPGERR